MTYTSFALVRRHPRGGYTVVYGSVEFSTTPEADPDPEIHYNTLQAACDRAAEDGYWSIHPECYSSNNKLVRGI